MTQSQQEIRQAPDLWSKIQPIKSPYSGTIWNFIKLTNQHTLIDLMVTSLRVNNSNITQVQNYLHLTDFRPVILKLEVFSPVGSSFNLFFRVFGNLISALDGRANELEAVIVANQRASFAHQFERLFKNENFPIT